MGNAHGCLPFAYFSLSTNRKKNYQLNRLLVRVNSSAFYANVCFIWCYYNDEPISYNILKFVDDYSFSNDAYYYIIYAVLFCSIYLLNVALPQFYPTFNRGELQKIPF